MKMILRILGFVLLTVVSVNNSIAQTATFNYSTSTGTLGSTYSWIDCYGVNEITSFTGGSDDGHAEIDWPFAFRFYDDNYSTSNQLSIGTNGFIRLDGDASTIWQDARDYDITDISSVDLGQIVALCVRDDDFTDSESHLFWKVTGTTPNQILTIEYDSVEVDYNSGKHVKIQVSFFQTSNKVVIKFKSSDASVSGVDVGINSGVTNYYNKWGDITGLTVNTWIEYTIPPFIWDGSSNSSWVVAANWNRNALPTSTDDVLIPSGTPNNPQLPTNNHGYCKNLTINSGATLTVNNSKKNLNVYGDIINNGTLSVAGGYNILLRGKDNVIKGTGTYSSNVKLRLRDSNTKYALETDLDIYRFDMFSGDNNCVLNIGSHTLRCSNHVRNDPSAANCTINITTGTIETAGNLINNGTINTGTGTIYYSKGGNQNVIDIQYYNLKLGGSGTKKVLANLDVNGDLTIESGTTLNSNSHTINVAGNWSNSGTFTQGSQIVTMDGSSAQTIGGSSTTTFYDLTVNNSAGLTLNHTTNLSHTLTLTSGIVNTTSSNLLIIGSSASAISGANSSRYIDGPVRKDGNSNFVFPVGDAGKYARIGISSLSGSDNFTAEYHNATPTNNTSFTYPITKVSDNEYWDLNRAGSSVSATVTLYWEDSKWSGIGNFSDLRIMHYGSSWTAESGTYSHTGSVGLGAANSGTLSVTGVSSFSPFSFGTIDNVHNPLPIDLLSFDAMVVDSDVIVNWQTASEKDNDYFIVERSKDGINSERIASIQGAGNSNEVLNYSFVDQNPYDGTSYYRLIQVDYDGHSETFDWVAVSIDVKEKLSVNVYPNPLTNGNLFLSLHNIVGASMVRVYDMNGRLLFDKAYSFDSNSQDVRLDIDLPKGIYSIQVINNFTIITKQLIVN